MSAFLGPIHHWVFNKVQFQDGVVNRLIELAKTNGLDLVPMLSERFGELEQQPLEDIIDGGNIHGWLQTRVSLVESRLAGAITIVLEKTELTISDLQELLYGIGKENKPLKAGTATDIFAYLNDTLLDGMPCDRVNETIAETDDTVTWRRNGCVHKQYWESVGGDIENFYILRDSLIRGMLDGSSFDYNSPQTGVYTLQRR